MWFIELMSEKIMAIICDDFEINVHPDDDMRDLLMPHWERFLRLSGFRIGSAEKWLDEPEYFIFPSAAALFAEISPPCLSSLDNNPDSMLLCEICKCFAIHYPDLSYSEISDSLRPIYKRYLDTIEFEGARVQVRNEYLCEA